MDIDEPIQPAISCDTGPSLSGLFSERNNGNAVANHATLEPIEKVPMFTTEMGKFIILHFS